MKVISIYELLGLIKDGKYPTINMKILSLNGIDMIMLMKIAS